MKIQTPNPLRVHYDYNGFTALLDACALYNSGRMFTLRYGASGGNKTLTINGFTLLLEVNSVEHAGTLEVDGYCAFYAGLPSIFRPFLSVSKDSEGQNVFCCNVQCGDERVHLFSGFYTEALHEALMQTRRVPNPALLFANAMVPPLFELSSCA